MTAFSTNLNMPRLCRTQITKRSKKVLPRRRTGATSRPHGDAVLWSALQSLSWPGTWHRRFIKPNTINTDTHRFGQDTSIEAIPSCDHCGPSSFRQPLASNKSLDDCFLHWPILKAEATIYKSHTRLHCLQPQTSKGSSCSSRSRASLSASRSSSDLSSSARASRKLLLTHRVLDQCAVKTMISHSHAPTHTHRQIHTYAHTLAHYH